MTRTSIRPGFISLAAATVATLALAGTGAAAAPVTVGYLACVGNGGVTVPAGSDVTVRIGWAESNRGLVQFFINDQTSTATIDGTPTDVSGLWSTPFALGDAYATSLRLPVGTLASAGDSHTVGVGITLAHRIPEGKDPDTGEHLSSGPGDLLPPGTCTITAT